MCSSEIILVSWALVPRIIREIKAKPESWMCTAWNSTDGGIRVSSLGLCLFNPIPAETLRVEGANSRF